MPRNAKGGKAPAKRKSRTPRQSRESVQAILDGIAKSVAAGAKVKDAVAKAGVSYSNYNYWRKRAGIAPSRRGKRGAAKAKTTGKGSVLRILQEMTENRSEWQRLQSAMARIEQLDARFRELTRQLEKAGT
ncbi:MAG: hypothetical protein IT364_14305 [Candidatus Hydrogenedentes bacterium]|nr:hypothetical protein [Candidatus Hydrogenedentota bacterium]